MATQVAAVDSAPSKAASIDVDAHAREYQQLQADLGAAKKRLKKCKDELVKLAQKRGVIPKGAEKSFRLEGVKYTITASFGTSSSVDEDVVEQIREELEEAHTPRLFLRLFHEEKSHIVAPTAPGVLENCSKKIRELYARVMSTKAKEPSLKVEKKKGGKK